MARKFGHVAVAHLFSERAGLATVPHTTGLTKGDITAEYVQLSLRVPGSKCDGPGCDMRPSGDTKLLKCQKCRRKYYCSKACQVGVGFHACELALRCLET
jgi:hypothetical protein